MIILYTETMKKWVGKNWFVLGIGIAVLLGILFPSFARLNRSGSITTAIVFVLFFSIGFSLPVHALKSGLANYRLHLFLQIFIFVVSPLYFFLATSLIHLSEEVRIGILALSVLPTTVSTCIVFTQASEGNTVGTMFNAVLSNVGGVFLSPLLLSFLLFEAGRTLPLSVLGGIIMNLCWKMLLPLAAGRILNMILAAKVAADKKKLGIFNNLMILLLVLFSIASSSQEHSFLGNPGGMGAGIALVAVSFYLLTGLALLLGKLFHFPDKDLISILYAAPQKTLAMGVPLLSTYFSDAPELLGTVMIPLLFYHPWQLLNVGAVRLLPVMHRVKEEALRGSS